MKADVGFTQHEDRIHGSDGRRRVVQVAANLFASAGLHGTTVSMIASAAGIPEGTLYAHFETKERLFRETVKNNIDTRLRLLEARAISAVYESEVAAVKRIAEATVTVCTSGAGNSILTSWALLEDHEYAANLYRDEIGSVEFIWSRALAQHFGDSPALRILSIHLVPYAASTSLAYGFWLAALRHDSSGAAAIAQGFVAGIGQTAAALVSKGNLYEYNRSPHDRRLPQYSITKDQ
jgi:AcrR family transcriptional regulator